MILFVGFFILKDLFFSDYIRDEKLMSKEYFQTYATVTQKDSKRIYFTYLCYDSVNLFTAIDRSCFDVGDILPVLVKKTNCKDVDIIMYKPCINDYEQTNFTNALVVDTWRFSYPHIWFEYTIGENKYLKCQYFQDKSIVKKIRVGDEIRIKYVIDQPTRAIVCK